MKLFCLGGLLFVFSSLVVGQPAQAQTDHIATTNLVYGKVADRELLVDVFVPKDVTDPPLLVWVHGGAWRGGSKENSPSMSFLDDGYAVASLDFRLSGEAMFPAQVHDIKAAIRFLRGNSQRYGYNADSIALLGASSGGHLVALTGVTNGHVELEGEIGDYVGESSDVQAIVSYYGASNLTTILSQSTPHGLNVRKPALDLFLGGQPEDNEKVAKLASPIFQIDRSDPPLLMLHGDQDPQMPINQSHELNHAYRQHDLEVHFEVVHGSAHGGSAFYDEERNAIVRAFLDKHLR